MINSLYLLLGSIGQSHVKRSSFPSPGLEPKRDSSFTTDPGPSLEWERRHPLIRVEKHPSEDIPPDPHPIAIPNSIDTTKSGCGALLVQKRRPPDAHATGRKQSAYPSCARSYMLKETDHPEFHSNLADRSRGSLPQNPARSRIGPSRVGNSPLFPLDR